MLPTDITIDILSRLPAESIYRCKQVCKSWRSLINHDRMFTRKYQSRLYEQNYSSDAASGKINLVFSVADMPHRHKQFYYAKYAPHERLMEYTRINLLPMDDMKFYTIVGSCNGLVCISMDEGFRMDEPIYICNPLTKQYLLLPSWCDTTLGSYSCFECGFGYIPSTNEYKVVKIQRCRGDVGKWVYVYTLGSGKGWRYISEITYKLVPSYYSVFLNGALHWLDNTQGNIVAFDLTEEKFSVIPLTQTCFINNWPLNRNPSCYELQVLGGSLCIVYILNDTYKIWLIEKGNNRNDQYSRYWSKDFNIGCQFRYIPLPKVIDVKKDDEALFFNEYSFYSHDLKQTRDQKFEWIMDFARNRSPYITEALIHVNSFVSLRALGEEDTKIFELTE